MGLWLLFLTSFPLGSWPRFGLLDTTPKVKEFIKEDAMTVKVEITNKSNWNTDIIKVETQDGVAKRLTPGDSMVVEDYGVQVVTISPVVEINVGQINEVVAKLERHGIPQDLIAELRGLFPVGRYVGEGGAEETVNPDAPQVHQGPAYAA